ncbi:hypothetical protein [Oceanobacillus sp. CF4.6]|uniref:hypothetical protein n=1 Tax=Oceanobacillus sp. CF4.6 TaxID=3373080 RepID=UPI003EE55DCC
MQITQKQLQEILMNVYRKGYQSKDINVMEIVDDIKQSLFTTYSEDVHKQDLEIMKGVKLK